MIESILEAKKLRKDLENKILNLLVDYEQRTGLVVADLDIEISDYEYLTKTNVTGVKLWIKM